MEGSRNTKGPALCRALNTTSTEVKPALPSETHQEKIAFLLHLQPHAVAVSGGILASESEEGQR